MCDCVVSAVDYETAMYQVMNSRNRKIFLMIGGERQKLRNISISGCMRVCFYLWKFSCFHSYCCRRTWWLVFWVLWRLTCCSQNIVAKAQQPIVTSHCLHMPLSRKRQCSVYRSSLNLIYYGITNMSVYLHTRGDTNWKLHSVELHRLASYLSKGWWRQRQAWELPLFVWPTNHNGAGYFLRTTRTWPCIFQVSAGDSNRETCSV